MTTPPNIRLEEEREEPDEDAGYRDVARRGRRLFLERRSPRSSTILAVVVGVGLFAGVVAAAWMERRAQGRDLAWDGVLVIAMILAGFTVQAAAITVLERKRVVVESGSLVVTRKVLATKNVAELALADISSFFAQSRQEGTSHGTPQMNHRVFARTTDGKDAIVLDRLGDADEAAWIATKLREHLGLPEAAPQRRSARTASVSGGASSGTSRRVKD